MKYLSVCSGIEAATVAWHPLGWQPVAFAEIESFPRALLAHHYPSVPLHGDFTTIKGHEYGAVDLLVGGTPCQSFSVAGLRKGLADPRGNLMLAYGALAQRLGAKWLVWENVPGVLSSNGGRDFGSFLGMLVELGYGFAYRVLDAQYFGVPQRRRRVFVVACLGDWRAPAAVLFERHCLQGHPAPSRKAWENVAGTISSRTTVGGGLGTDFELGGGLQPVAFGGNNQAGPIDIATARNACTSSSGRLDFETETFLVQPSLIAFDSRQDCVSSTALFGSLGSSSPQAQAVCVTGDITHTLKTEGFDASEDGTGRGQPIVSVGVDCYNGSITGDFAATMGTRGSSETASGPTLLTGMAVRRLTPRECERLQGFKDDYTLVPMRNKNGKANGKWSKDGPRYKALGNSMAVPCMRWIGERIQGVIDLQSQLEAA